MRYKLAKACQVRGGKTEMCLCRTKLSKIRNLLRETQGVFQAHGHVLSKLGNLHNLFSANQLVALALSINDLRYMMSVTTCVQPIWFTQNRLTSTSGTSASPDHAPEIDENIDKTVAKLSLRQRQVMERPVIPGF